MYSITAEDLEKAKVALEKANGGKGPKAGTTLLATLKAVSGLEVVEGLALGAMALGIASGEGALQDAIAVAILAGFQAGLTRAVDEPVRALVESTNA